MFNEYLDYTKYENPDLHFVAFKIDKPILYTEDLITTFLTKYINNDIHRQWVLDIINGIKPNDGRCGWWFNFVDDKYSTMVFDMYYEWYEENYKQFDDTNTIELVIQDDITLEPLFKITLPSNNNIELNSLIKSISKDKRYHKDIDNLIFYFNQV